MMFIRKTKLPSKIKPDFVQDDLDSQFPQCIESSMVFLALQRYVITSHAIRKREREDLMM